MLFEKGGDCVDQQQLQQEIISCVWSKDFKDYIREHNYTFDSRQLLAIAYHFAPTYAERLRLLGLLAEYAPDVSRIAQSCIRYQRELWEKFCLRGDNEVYELHIKETPDAYDERYLCASYQTALDMIDGFYREYALASEKETVCYTISKRRILQATDGFSEDALLECTLMAGKVLVCVDTWFDKNNPANEIADPEFPGFIPHLSAVRYRKGNHGIGRGVCLTECHLPADSCYVIPFDTQLLQSREYEKHLGSHWHEHIPGPNIEVLPVEELTEGEKDDYFAFVQYWKQRHQH